MAIGTSQAFRTQNFRLLGNFYDKDNWVGKKGYYLSSDEQGVHWEADQNETSGIFSGGIITATIGGTTFNVSAGVGQVVSRTLDIPTGEVKTNTTRVSWNTQSNIALTYRTTHPFSYIYIDENGAIQQQNSSFTDAEYKNKIILGTICHIDLATINLVTNKQNITYGDSHRLYELISTFGPIKRSGLAVSAYTTNLRLKRESGVAFLIGSNYTTNQFEPDSISLNSANPASLCRVYKNGTGGFVFDTNSGSFYTDVDPNKYDNGSGTLQTVNNNQWTIQRLFFFPNNPNDIIAYYGIEVYNSYGDAVTAMATESFSEATITAENAVFLAYLVVRGGATDLSLVSDGKFFQSGAFRNIGAIGGGGGGAGAIILDDLTDVAITTPLDGQFLAYDGGTSLWKNSTLNAVNPLVFNGIGTSLTLSLNYATASQPGGVSTSAQTFGGTKTFANDVIVSGNFTVNGTTTTIDAQTLVVEDKNIELGVVASPTDLTADGGGITLKGTTDKTFNWIDATDSWTSSENLDLASGKSYKINGTDVLTSTTLGSGVINSSLESVGILNNLTVAGYAHLAITSGNVGIGTDTPSQLVEAYKSINAPISYKITNPDSGSSALSAFYAGNGSNQTLFLHTGTNFSSVGVLNYPNLGCIYNNSAGISLAAGSGSGVILFATGSLVSEKMRIANNGNVGIGTENPNEKLSIYPGTTGGIALQDSGGTTRSYFFIDNTNPVYSTGIRTENYYLDFDSSGGAQNAIRFYTGIGAIGTGTERMRITSIGNIGIGTTNPSQFLEVRRTAGSAIALLNYNDDVKLNVNASSSGAGYIGMVSDHPLIFVTNDVAKVKIGTNGNVCIGNGDANNKLSVLGSASVGSNYNVAAPTNGLLIEGSVGIGLTNPSYKLDISSSLTGTTVGSNVVLNIESQASGRDVEIRLGDTVNSSKRLGYLSGNFYIASGTTENFRIDVNGNVGVNTTNPATRLEIADLNVITDSIGNLFVRTTNNQGINIGGQISLGGYYSASNIYTFGSIAGRKENATSGNVAGYLALSTTTSGGTNTERVRINSDGNVGINVTSPLARLHTVGQVFIDNYTSLTAKNILTLNVNGANYAHIYDTGLAGNVIAIGGASTISTVPSSSIMSWDLDDAKVGIGTNTPSYKLDVSGSIGATSATISNASGANLLLTSTGSNAYSYITFTNTTARSFDIGTGGSGTGVNNGSWYVYDNTASAHRLLINSNGNVGIGITTPSQLVEAYKSFNGDIVYQVTNPNTGANATAQFFASNGTTKSQFFHTGTSYSGTGVTNYIGLGGIYNASTGISLSAAGASGIILFGTGTSQTERMRITSDGSIGIGTTNPLAKLQVTGGRSYFFSGDQYSVGLAQTAAQANYMYLGTASDGTFYISETGGAAKVAVQQDGKVGIGTTSPADFLHIYASAGTPAIRLAGAGVGTNTYRITGQLIGVSNTGFGIYDTTNSTYRLVIDGNGNVGIGSVSTNNKLYVSGSASIGSNYNIAAPTNGLIVEGNVGIGTSTVSTKLHVSGGTYISNIVGTGDLRIENTDTVGVGISLKNHTGKYWFMYNGGSSSWAGDGVLGFVYTDGVNAATGPKVVFKSDGNVGIGLNNPSRKLDIRKNNSGESFLSYHTGGNGTLSAGIDLNEIRSDDATTVYNLLNINVNSTPRFLVTATGNVGIGTASPDTSLEVYAIPATSTTLRRMLTITTDFASASGAGFGGSIVFKGRTPGNVLQDNAQISAYNEDIGDNGYALGFYTRPTVLGGLQQRMTILRGGNIGIGTTTPAYKLHVYDSSVETVAKFRSVGDTTIIIGGSDASSGEQYITYQNGTTGGNAWMVGMDDGEDFRFAYGSAGEITDGNSKVKIGIDGNVGIGTNSPAYKLEVASGTSGQQSLVNFRTADSTTANNAGIQIFATPSATATSREAVMALDADGANASGGDYFLIKKRGNSGTTDFEQYSNASMRFGTNFISRATYDMTIANDGNVGIGTISPSARLTIVDNTNGGTIHLVGRTSDDTAAINFRATGDASTYAYISPDTNEFRLYHNDGFMSFYPGGTEKVRIKSDGNVGIGITSPIAKFHASYGTDAQSVKMIGTGGSTNGNFIYSLASDYSDSFGLNVFATNHSNPARANTLVRIHSNETSNGGLPLRVTAQGSITSPTYEALAVNYLGNVGIGTTNPISKLDVRGQTYINNGLGTGSGQALIVAGSGDVQLSDGGSLFFGAYSYGSSTYIRGYDDLDIMYFYSNGTNIMNVRSTGVGIGTANPGAKLEIKDGDLWLNGASSASNPEIRFIDDSGISVAGANIRYNNSDGNLYIEHVYNNAASGIFFRNRTAGTSLSTLSLVNGDVGIANTSPLGSASSGLTLGAIGTIKCFNIGMQNTYGRIRERDQIDALAITTNINDGGVQDSATRSSWKLRMGWGNGQDNFLISRSPVGSNVFADLFYVKADGNIGIGTTSPTEKLHIQNGRLLIDTTSANASGIWMPDTNGNPSIRIVTDTSAAEYCSIINNWGNSSNSGLLVGTTRNDGIAFQVRTGVTTTSGFANNDGSTRMIVLGSGYVGIGTTAPSTNLEVIGTVKATTFEGGFSQISVTTDDATNSSHYIYFGANASGSVNVKASTKIRYNPSTGAFSATTKSFRIPHPTKPEHDLVYGSLESPYHGIRLTGKGKTNGTCVEIILPDYVNTLVDENTVNIQITAYKCAKVFYVENINIKDNKFVVKYDKSWYQKAKDVEFFWDFTAERKDVPKLVVEEKL